LVGRLILLFSAASLGASTPRSPSAPDAGSPAHALKTRGLLETCAGARLLQIHSGLVDLAWITDAGVTAFALATFGKPTSCTIKRWKSEDSGDWKFSVTLELKGATLTASDFDPEGGFITLLAKQPFPDAEAARSALHSKGQEGSHETLDWSRPATTAPGPNGLVRKTYEPDETDEPIAYVLTYRGQDLIGIGWELTP
jgi:hypothetical protein